MLKTWEQFNENKGSEIDYDQFREDVIRLFEEDLEIPGNVPLYKSSGKQQTIYTERSIIQWALKQQNIERELTLRERNKIVGTTDSVLNTLEKEGIISSKLIAKFLPWSGDRYGFNFYYKADISDEKLEDAIKEKEDELKEMNSKFLDKQKEKAEWRKEHTKKRRRVK